MRLALSAALLLTLIAPASAQSVAETLRAPAKHLLAKDLPDGLRAVNLAQNSEGVANFSILSIFGSGFSEDADHSHDGFFMALTSSTLVDPDEFEALLNGKRPRITGYTLDLPAMTANLLQRPRGESRSMPEPVFIQVWIEAGRVSTWAARPEVTKDAIIQTFTPPLVPTESSLRAKEISNVKQIALGMMMYMGDADDVFPFANSTEAVKPMVYPYLKTMSVCTSTNPKGGRILYNTTLSALDSTVISSPSETLLVWDENAWPDGGRVVGYADGHVKYVNGDDWSGLWLAEQSRRKTKPKAAPTKTKKQPAKTNT